MNQLYRALRMPKDRLIKKLSGQKEIYTIGIRKRNGDLLLFEDPGSEFTSIPYSAECWYADPIPFTYEGEDYLFAEKFDMQKKKGELAVTKLDRIDFQTVISEDYHLSFPNVFEYHDRIYMIPESSENRSINLYLCTDFPYSWTKIKESAVDRELVDTIIVKMDEKYIYVVSSEICTGNPLKVKYVYSSIDCSDGGFYLNYVKEDDGYNYTDRFAGKLFSRNDETFMVTQESTEIDYGVFLNFRNIESNKKYKISSEQVKISGVDNKNIIGIHTYGVTACHEFIDARYLKKIK